MIAHDVHVYKVLYSGVHNTRKRGTCDTRDFMPFQRLLYALWECFAFASIFSVCVLVCACLSINNVIRFSVSHE